MQQALKGAPWVGSYSVDPWVSHLKGHLDGVLLCRSAGQALKGAPWVGSYSVVQWVRRSMGPPLYCSAADAGVWGERGYGDGSSPFAWLNSIALSPWLPGFPPQAFPTPVSSLTPPLIHLSAVNSSPHPGMAPESLNSSSQPLHLLGDLSPCPGYGWLWQGLSNSHSN